MAHRNVLLVEGMDDAHVFYHLVTRHNIPCSMLTGFRRPPALESSLEVSITIKPKQGLGELLEAIEGELVGSEIRRLGVVVDADEGADRRWRRLREILLKAGYGQIPNRPGEGGTLVTERDKPTLGIWIMPDNCLPGKLENFIEFLIPEEDGLWSRAQDAVNQIPPEQRRFQEAARVKAQVHTWLAWQAEPGTPLGLAITRRYLDADAPHAKRLLAWLRQLFALEEPSAG